MGYHILTSPAEFEKKKEWESHANENRTERKILLPSSRPFVPFSLGGMESASLIAASKSIMNYIGDNADISHCLTNTVVQQVVVYVCLQSDKKNKPQRTNP